MHPPKFHSDLAPSQTAFVRRVNRRGLLLGASGLFACALMPRRASAKVPAAYDWNAAPPTDSRAAFIEWMQKNRGEPANFLGQRFDRFQALLGHHDLWDKRNIRAYLLTPREDFV